MIWRLWCFGAAMPLGVLAALAWRAEPELVDLQLAALGSGALMLAVVSLAARRRDDDPERGRHLASGATAALVAVPALCAAWLGFAPGARALLVGAAVVTGLGVARGARVRGPSRALAAQAATVLIVLVIGSLAVLSVAALAAAWARRPEISSARAAAMYDYDARVPLLPATDCSPAPARVELLMDHGAHPRLSRDGATLWYDAAVDDGTRQVHSLERASGVETCWTCGEPGRNLRPHPGANGRVIVFDTDRHADWRHPANTELHLLSVRRASAKPRSRRLTREPGADDHAVFGPDTRVVAWSRGADGRFAVVIAPIVSGHGGILLGSRSELYASGSGWTAPLAWSADARALVVAHGNPFEPLPAVVVDPATGTERETAAPLIGAAGASFSADGRRIALASARRHHAAGLLPDGLGFALASLARALGGDEPLHRDAVVLTGETWSPGAAVALAEAADWGTPTGVALEPDGRGFVLGQRRETEAGIEERMVEVALTCAS
ncbi:MAG: hypothetical protein JSU66_01875 [Deltaproteobacteria bacterium]|nr:MAG: hypothetical protein JSU66_01875 [Deltaproteobacteria bacterium]